ncbi:acyl-CoA thioesterase [Microbispora sp. ATCC PTA-5024]|uniref:acyl-CoA thioesterase n=1 Tax=Microbispora sp. ATCC PTA-5024 TaxID=316330 RepID=UPI0004233ECA|nr:thioesterase family protein [Microbispora sp. ATCC PTA-5024]
MTPHFSCDSEVYFDELDVNGVLHNSRYAVHVERALTAWFEAAGRGWRDPRDRHEDIVYAVREFTAEFLAPVTAPTVLRVDLRLDRVGRTSAVHRWRCSDAGVVVARGQRAIVKIDPATGTAKPWTGWFRSLVSSEV